MAWFNAPVSVSRQPAATNLLWRRFCLAVLDVGSNISTAPRMVPPSLRSGIVCSRTGIEWPDLLFRDASMAMPRPALSVASTGDAFPVRVLFSASECSRNPSLHTRPNTSCFR